MESEKRGWSRGEVESLTAIFPQTFRPFGEQRSSPLRNPTPHPSRTLPSSSAIRKPGWRHSKCVPKAAFPEIANVVLVVKTLLAVQET